MPNAKPKNRLLAACMKSSVYAHRIAGADRLLECMLANNERAPRAGKNRKFSGA